MLKSGRTFSESWHRVAGLRVSLRPTVEMRRQYFRGEKWYVVQDPFNNQFFRIRPACSPLQCKPRGLLHDSDRFLIIFDTLP